MFYEPIEANKVHCFLCPHHCRIDDGKKGLCMVRENRGGVLYTLTYGKTVATGVDPVEKKPLYHFMEGSLVYSFATVGCNLRCGWCQNYRIAQAPRLGHPVRSETIPPEAHVRRAKERCCDAIAYTYSEPTIFFEYALDTMKASQEESLKNVWVSNGYITGTALKELLPYMDAANIDYKGPDDKMYMHYCGGRGTAVLETLKRLKEGGVHLEITTLVIPGINDADHQLRAIVDSIVKTVGTEVPWHISRFFPAWKMSHLSPTPLERLEKAKSLAEAAGMTTIHLGNV